MQRRLFCLLLLMLLCSALFAQQQASAPPKLEPFLTLPVKSVKITEGWKYGKEASIHPTIPTHFAADFQRKRGTPVRAAADGWAIASFHTSFLPQPYQGKKAGFGLGWFVEIMHPLPGGDVFTTYNHLDRIASDLPFFPPSGDEVLGPDVVYEPFRDVLAKGRLVNGVILKPVFVRRGQVIGYVGDSGLSWGYKESWNIKRDYKTQKTWDPAGPHLHFEVFTRNAKGLKDLRWDPFDLYATEEAYVGRSLGPNSLWILNKKGRPLFVK